MAGSAGLIRWLHAREEQGLARCSEEATLAEELEAAAWQQATTPSVMASIIKSAEARHDPAHAEARAAQQRQALAERERQRRQHDPQAELRTRLERTVATTAVAMPAQGQAAPIRSRGRHNGSRPIGECGRRIGAAIDAVLADIRAMEDESTWPDDEFPWEGLEAVIAEVQAEAAAPTALATPAMPAPPMPPMPVVKPEPAVPGQPQVSSVWEQLDLSPRARALGALVAAVHAGGPQACLPMADAVALLEALL